jgi:hypothetical protein
MIMNEVVEFYRGSNPNKNGDYLKDIMRFTDGQLEMDHDWVQWVFPSNEPSMMNCDAPTLTRIEAVIFQADPALQEKVKRSLTRFLAFLEFEIIEDAESLTIKPTAELPRWLRSFNHNMLRITRVLKCLRLVGLTQYANVLYDALRAYKNKVSANTWEFWTHAVFEPLEFLTDLG